jgi:catechol 2,3-dioxygenase-like lactoylglutathione lyase family enzyme
VAIFGAEIGFVSTDRQLVDFLAHVFELDELPPVEADAEIMDQVPAARPFIQYRLQAREGLIVKVTVPEARPRPDNIADHVLDGTGLRYVTFYVTDLLDVVARAKELGGHIEQSPIDLTGASVALIRDPDGNLYELAEISS